MSQMLQGCTFKIFTKYISYIQFDPLFDQEFLEKAPPFTERFGERKKINIDC